MRLAPALLTLPFVAALAAAQPATPPAAPPPAATAAVRAVRATEPIVVDGVLNEPVWKSDNAVSYLPQCDPNEGAPAAQQLEIRVAYDDDAIYVGARMFDTSPDSIVARLSRRDNNAGSDLFAVSFDTFHDKRNGYYFAVSAAGTQYDGTHQNDDWDDDSWDGVWSSKVKRDAQGWTAEMRIPFSQMRCAAGDQRVWGINFERYIQRYNQDQKLAYTPRGQSGFVSRWPELVGLDGIRMTHHVEISPYTTGRAEHLAPLGPGDPFHDGSRYKSSAGGDLRTNLGAKMTLNATVNPDFGQVEIDPASVNLSDVETFYNEKRPFFTEGLSVFRCGNNGASDYWNFNWPEPMFWYTRRIGRSPEIGPPGDYADMPVATRILGALKLTGQPAPRLNVGAVSALTQKEVADYELGDGSRGSATVEPMTYYGILRGLRSFNHERQGLGLMGLETHRFFDGTHLDDALNGNGLVGAMDGWTFLDPRKVWVVSGYAAASRTDGTPARIADLEQSRIHYFQRPDRPDLGVDANATSLTGAVTRLWLNKQSGQWMSNSAIGFISPGFDANDLGLSSRDDIINGHVGVGYNWNKPHGFKKTWWALAAIAQGWNFAGQHLLNQLFLKTSLEQMNAWSWQLSGGLTARGVADRLTRGGPAMTNPQGGWADLYWDTNSKSKVFLYNEVQVDGDGEGAHHVNVTPGVTWKPSSNLSFSMGPNLDWNHEDAHYITTQTDAFAPSLTYGHRYVFATLEQRTVGAQMRVDCSLTPALSLQMFVQPLVSSGRYWDYRELARGSSYSFNGYGTGGSTVTADPGSGDITIDPAGDGTNNEFSVHPDFTYRTVRGNAVLRWEYVPGSAFYLVWTQDRTGLDGDGSFRFGRSLSDLATAPVNNIVLVKVSHHFDL